MTEQRPFYKEPVPYLGALTWLLTFVVLTSSGVWWLMSVVFANLVSAFVFATAALFNILRVGADK